MNIEIVQRGPSKFVGFSSPFISLLSKDATSMQVIGPLWQRFIPRLGEVRHKAGETCGVMWFLPAAQRKHPEELMYLAGIEVSDFAGQPKDMACHEMPAATFARITHKGPLSGLEKSIRDIHDWVQQSDYDHTDVGELEIYDDRFDPNSPASEFDYLISVASR
ncbi:MAG: GyrI-like domain-containing protein [Planctomycetes bacterium]|nr:GyrI-like domain-containing protein [Planctomycetota bacterium]